MENVACESFTFDPSKDVKCILDYGMRLLSTYTAKAEKILAFIEKLDSEIDALTNEKQELENLLYTDLHSYLCIEMDKTSGPRESIDKNLLKLKDEMIKFKDLSNSKIEKRDSLKKEVKQNNDQCKNLKETKENIDASLKENEPLKAEFKTLSAILNLGYKNNSEGTINTGNIFYNAISYKLTITPLSLTFMVFAVLLKEKDSVYRSFKVTDEDKSEKKLEEDFWKALESRERLKVKGKI